MFRASDAMQPVVEPSFTHAPDHLGSQIDEARQLHKNGPLLMVAYIGVLLFLIVYFFRPEDFITILRVVPLAKIAGLLTGIALLGAIFGEGASLARDSKVLLIFLGYLCLTIPVSYWRAGSFDVVVNGFSKYVLIAVAAACAASSISRLRRLMLVQTLAMFTLAQVSLFFPSRAGRMYGVGQMFSDPNDLALNLCIVMPLCIAFLLSARSGVVKVFWTGVAVIMLIAIVFTSSRGGTLTLIAVAPAILIRFRIKARVTAFLVLLLVCTFTTAAIFAGSSYIERMKTIADPDSEASSEARHAMLIASLHMTMRHPIFGVGPGQFEQTSGFWHQTHNSYTQLSSEAGIPALILFIYLIRRTFKNLRQCNRECEENVTLHLVNGVYCGMIAYVVGAFFLSTGFWLVPYLLMAYATALSRMSREVGAGANHGLNSSFSCATGSVVSPQRMLNLASNIIS